MRSVQSQIAWCARAQWTMVTIMATLIALYLLFGYWPSSRRLSAMADEMATKSKQLATNQSRASNLSTLAWEVDRLRLKLERNNKKLPKTAEIGEFLKEMTNAAQQLGIQKLNNQPGMVKRQDLFAEIPITMSFEGAFTDVFRFIRELEGMSRLTRVKTLSVHSRNSKQGMVDVNMAMNIYFSEQQ
jgi:Tfp pilus assembly protein PilO